PATPGSIARLRHPGEGLYGAAGTETAADATRPVSRAGARGWVPGRPGCRPGAWRPRAIRGRGRTPARDHPAGTGPWNVAVEQSSAVSVAWTQEGAAARRVRIPIPPSRSVI